MPALAPPGAEDAPAPASATWPWPGCSARTPPRAAASEAGPSRWRPKPPHFPAKAKRIIFLFMEGAMSQMDTWEYKPQLQKDDGKAGPGGGTLTASKFQFAQHGQTGTWVSELYPNVARHVDKLCFLRGLHTDTPAHPQAVIQLHTGTAIASLTRPSMGAWLLYGLGTENQDLPGYITINPPPNFGGAVNYGSAFLPAHFQGTRISDPATCRTCKAADAAVAAAQAARPDPGDEPRPGGDARRARPGRGRDPVVRAGVPDAGQGAGAARHLEGAAGGAATPTA